MFILQHTLSPEQMNNLSRYAVAHSFPFDAVSMYRQYKTNCVSSLMVTQTFLPLTQSQPSPAQHPVVAFISSNFASIGTTFGGMVSYRCSKAALNMMVRTLAQEISFGETSPKQEQKLEDADGEEREIRGKSDVAKKPVFLLLSPGWAQARNPSSDASCVPIWVSVDIDSCIMYL